MGIPGDRNDEAIVRTIVTLAHNLGLQVIAEGVEAEAQCALLEELGCAEIQGYHVSRPLPADRLLELLRQGEPSMPVAHAPRNTPSRVPCFLAAS
jgi:EAL domain-containing protein (putative c-di-GMP-specific phosphodiesterase class I)